MATTDYTYGDNIHARYRQTSTTGIQTLDKKPIVRIKYKSPTPNQSGGVIVLAGGQLFRKATAIERGLVWTEGQSHQIDSGTRTGTNIFSENVGDYNFDRVLNETAITNPVLRRPEWGATIYDGPSIPLGSRNESVTKALLDLADGKAGMGENLATMSQTVRMLRNPITFLAKGIKSAYRNQSWKPFLRHSLNSLQNKGLLTASAERYLEYVYGWRPLMQDIHGLIELAKEQGDLPLLLRGRGKSTQSYQAPGGSYYATSYGTDYWAETIDVQSKVRTSLWARIDPNHQGLRSLNQLGLANPLALAWELVSFSFVVDWLIPIGPVLNALSAPAGLIFVNGSTSHRLSWSAPVTARWRGIKNLATSGYTLTSDCTRTVRYEGYQREIHNTWPLPGFWYDKDPLRSDRPLKALALTIANLPRH